MGLRFLSLLFLLVAVACAVPTFEDEIEDLAPMEETEDVIEDDVDDMEDPMQSLEEDEEDEEEDPKKKKYFGLFGDYSFCVCLKPSIKGDVQEEISDHIDKIAEDVELSDPAKSKKFNFKKFLKKLVSPYFHSVNLKCSCTVNKPVVRLMRFLKISSVIGRRRMVMFLRRLRRLISAVKKQKSIRR